MLDTILLGILIVLMCADLVLERLATRRLRAQVLALARERNQHFSIHEIKVECDNTVALEKLAEIEQAANAAALACKSLAEARDVTGLH